ncbi:DUF2255 family protein [Microbacterium sp. Marseille-Q6965]|uniref:DUF2255 family protein n=1 Tax=Microbacterium sp. Marseille-Q6965 TaxID=2965072 RepID=UPI0021B72443|nr:DUF2255 family protein [Microbacterium sp. Marseille-Q6965]
MAYDDVVTVLDETQVVAIVTTRRGGEPAATAIWSMVVDGVPYVRSAYGERSWWYKHVVAGRPVAFVLGDGSLAERDRAGALELPRERVTLTPVPADDPVQAAISAEVKRKYAGSERSAIDATNSPEAVACTFRVDPV